MTNWPTKKLSEIQDEIKKEKAPVGTVPYIEIGNVDIESKKVAFTDKGAVKGSVFCPENSILISRVRPTRGAVVLINRKYAVSSAFTIIKPKINHRLFFYFLAWNKKFFEYLGNLQKGTSYPSVRESDILDFKISFPEDLNEQQKIVHILDSVQAGIWVQDKIIEKTKELKKSLVRKLFREGTRGEKLKKTEIGEIPENWEAVRLGEVLKTIQYGISKKGEKAGKYPILRMNNLINGKIDISDLQYVDLNEQKFKKLRLSRGDIIFNRTNSIDLVGKTSIFDLNGEFVFASYLLRLKTLREKLSSEFLNYYFNRDYTQNELKKLASRGASQVNISASRLKTFKLPLSPIPEQREIAEILQTIDQKIEIEQKKKVLYEELFKTMLNKLMSGEIKVDKV